MLLALLVALGLAQAGAAAGGAFCVRVIFDGLGQGFALLSPLTAGLVASALAVALLEAAQRAAAEWLGLDYTSEVRLGLFDHLARMAPARLARRSQGGLMLPFVGDLSALRLWASQGLARLVVGAASTLGLLAALAAVSPGAAAACSIVLACGAVAVVLLGGPLEHSVRRLRRRRARLTAFVASRLAALGTVQALGGGARERSRVLHRNRSMNRAGLHRALIAGAVRGLSRLTGALLAATALLAGGVALSGGAATPGTVAAAMGLVALMGPAIHDLGRAFELWRPAKVSAEKIARLMDEPVRPEVAAGRRRRGAAPAVFENVRVLPRGPVLDAKLRGGAVVSVVGPSGAGKSAFANLAAGIETALEGRLLVRGRDGASLSPARRRRLIGFASAAAPLVRGSLRLNLVYRAPRADAAALAEVISLCGLDRLIRRLPGGLDGQLVEGGHNLSEGERQAVLAARALLGEPDLLILDGVDSALDPDVARRIAERLRGWKGGVLMIARRPEFLAVATETWVVGRERVSVRRHPIPAPQPSIHEAA